VSFVAITLCVASQREFIVVVVVVVVYFVIYSVRQLLETPSYLKQIEHNLFHTSIYTSFVKRITPLFHTVTSKDIYQRIMWNDPLHKLNKLDQYFK